MTKNTVKIIAGNANPALAREVSTILKFPLSEITANLFEDGECNVNVGGNFTGCTTIVIQPTSPPVNDNLLELLLIFDALKRAGSDRIIAVVPYFGYARKDKKFRAGDPISARLVANMVEQTGVSHIILVELHTLTEEGFFNIPSTHISTGDLFASELRHLKLKNPVVVSPDLGGIKKARDLAKVMGSPLAVVNKERDLIQSGNLAVTGIFGEVAGRDAIIMDDLIATGTTLVKAAHILKEKGAGKIVACATHAAFNERTPDTLQNSPIDQFIVANTCAIPKQFHFPKLKIASLAPLLSQVIQEVTGVQNG